MGFRGPSSRYVERKIIFLFSLLEEKVNNCYFNAYHCDWQEFSSVERCVSLLSFVLPCRMEEQLQSLLDINLFALKRGQSQNSVVKNRKFLFVKRLKQRNNTFERTVNSP